MRPFSSIPSLSPASVRRISCLGSAPAVLVSVMVVLLTVVGGCSLTPSMPVPDVEQILPDRYTATADTSLPPAAHDTADVDVERWWTVYDDSTLTALVDSALARNRDLVQARARLEELQAQYRIARAPLFPSATASGNASDQSQPANIGSLGELTERRENQPPLPGRQPGAGLPDQFDFRTYRASLGLSYEIDFWGRIRSRKNAALSEFFATAADVRNTRLAIISQTISTYFEWEAQRKNLRLTERTRALLRQRAALSRRRYERGLSSSFELYSVQQQLDALTADEPASESRLYDAQTRLATLVGRFNHENQLLGVTGTDSLPDAAGVPGVDTLDLDPVPAGLPSDLLMQRPDVRAAAARVEAGRQRIGVARAQRLPRLSLTAEGGTQSSTLDDLLDYDQRFSSFIASLTAPLFRGGELRANVDVAQARYRQQVAAYERTLLTAFQEVRSALVDYEKQRQRYDRVIQQLESSRASVRVQRRRFERGQGAYVPFLDAEQNLVQVRQRLVSAEHSLVLARLALHRALGGSWTNAPPIEDPRLFH